MQKPKPSEESAQVVHGRGTVALHLSSLTLKTLIPQSLLYMCIGVILKFNQHAVTFQQC